MKKTIVVYSLAIAAAALALQWLQYQYTVRVFSTEIYIAILALGFTALGVWGRRPADGATPRRRRRSRRISRRSSTSASATASTRCSSCSPRGTPIRRSRTASSCRPIPSRHHLGNLYGKLEVSRRTQAVQKARALKMIP